VVTEGTLGIRPGLGYRPFARPIFVWMVGAQFVDPGLDHPDPAHASNRPDDGIIHPTRSDFTTTPDMCPPGPDYLEAARQVKEASGFVLAVESDVIVETSPKMDPTYSVERFLRELDTPVDLDGDGDTELPLLYADWQRILDTGEDPALVEAVGAVIEHIENEIDFKTASLEVEGDTHGFVASVTPSHYDGLQKGDKISFKLQFRGVVPALENDQVFRMGLNVLTDGKDLVDHKDILVVVPGRTR